MYLFIKVVIFGLLLSIAEGKNNNKVEISATCNEIKQRKSQTDEKYC